MIRRLVIIALCAIAAGCSTPDPKPSTAYPYHGPIMNGTNRVEAPRW